MSFPERVVVVGASLAGLRAVEGLRRHGYAGPVTLIGAEEHLPYDRPPLSKELLVGEWDAERVGLRGPLSDPGRLSELDVDLRIGRRATALDLDGRHVQLDDGSSVGFDGIVLATGSRARPWPGPAPVGVHVLRTLDDALALRADLATGDAPVVVVGGGFIGAEVAAAARHHGRYVTVLEALEVPLSRVLGPEMGAALAVLHVDAGVEVRCGVQVAGFVGDDVVEGVALSDGEVVPAGVVVVGIGASPNTEWLEGSGLNLSDGIVCDDTLHAAPGVVAAGDVARFPSRRFAESIRVEHWTHAVESGLHAAASLLAGEGAERFDPVPYVWSDQYEHKILYAGRSHATDPVEVVAGSVADRRFTALYRRGPQLVGALALNMPRSVAIARRLMADDATFEQAREALGA